jgi:hypothetical protein
MTQFVAALTSPAVISVEKLMVVSLTPETTKSVFNGVAAQEFDTI